MRFGDYIRKIREENGWTQPEAAARISVEQSYLSKMETGKSYPSEDVFAKLVPAYSLNVDDMAHNVFSAELDKLRDIADIRTALKDRQKNQQKFMRSWLVAGLVMLMISGASFGIMSIEQKPMFSFIYTYSSPGVIKKGENPQKYTRLSQAKFNKNITELNDAMDFTFKEYFEKRDDNFVEKVDGGHRIYSFTSARPYKPQNPLAWLIAPALMFLFGGIACFYISRRWQ